MRQKYSCKLSDTALVKTTPDDAESRWTPGRSEWEKRADTES